MIHFLTAALLLTGCSGSEMTPDDTPTDLIGDTADDTADDTASDTADALTLESLDGSCDPADRWGGFSVEADEQYSLVSGIVRDGIIPANVLDLVTTSGECTLWMRTNPYCNPGCETGYTCNDAGECIPYPLGQDLGTVTIDGLLGPVAMTPVEPDKSYFSTSLPNPPWTEGGVIRLTAGDLVLEGVGLTAFVPAEATWTLAEGAPLSLSWPPPAAGALSTVHLELTIDQHGATPLALTCELADDGAGEVPAELIDAMITSGVTGYPNGRIGRRTADRAGHGEGCVDLVVTQPLFPDVVVSGHYPCTQDRDCPEGMSCNEALEVCE